MLETPADLEEEPYVDPLIERAKGDLSPENLIDCSQLLRLQMVAEKDIDPKLKLAAINAIANTAVGVKRITTEASSADADREVAKALTEQLKTINKNPFMIVNTGDVVTNHVVAPEVPAIDLVPEETSTTLANIEVDEIMSPRD